MLPRFRVLTLVACLASCIPHHPRTLVPSSLPGPAFAKRPAKVLLLPPSCGRSEKNNMFGPPPEVYLSATPPERPAGWPTTVDGGCPVSTSTSFEAAVGAALTAGGYGVVYSKDIRSQLPNTFRDAHSGTFASFGRPEDRERVLRSLGVDGIARIDVVRPFLKGWFPNTEVVVTIVVTSELDHTVTWSARCAASSKDPQASITETATQCALHAIPDAPPVVTLPPDPSASPHVTFVQHEMFGTATSLGPDAVEATIRASYLTGIEHCYADVLRTDSRAHGNARLEIDIDKQGMTWRHNVASFSAELDTCIDQQMTKWQFAIPRNGDTDPTTTGMGFTLDLQPHPASVAAPDAKQADPQVAFTLLGAAIEDARELERHARSLEDRIEVCDSDRPEDFGGSCKEMFIACRRSLGAAGDPKIRTACMHLYGSGSRLPVELPAPDGPHLDDTQIAQLKAGCAANKQSCLAIDTACKTFPAWTAELTQLCEVTRADRERVRDPVSSAGPPVGLVLEGMLGGFSPSGNVGLQYGGSVGLRVEHAWGFGLRQSEGAVLALGARATLGGYQLLGTNGDLQLNFAALYDFESFQLGAVIAVGGDTLGTHVAQLGLPDAGFAGYGLGAFELRAGGPGEHFTFLFGGADRFAPSLDRELRGEAIVELRRLAIGARFQRWDDGPTSVTIGTAFGLTVGSIF